MNVLRNRVTTQQMLERHVADQIEAQVRLEMRVWLVTHPRRSLRLRGSVLSLGEPQGGFEHELGSFDGPKVRRVLQPLRDLVRWLEEMEEMFKVELGTIEESGPKSGHAYFTVGGMLCNADGTRSIFDDVDE